MSSLAFLGSPAVSAACLDALVQAGHDITWVVSGRDKRRGRGGATSPTPVKEAALALGLPVSDRVEDALSSGAELGVVVAFGRIIRPEALALLPMVNLHFSLLPRWRGAAPVERAILAGDERTGVCLMKVEAGLDEGGVYARRETAIGPEETAEELTTRLGVLGTELLLEALAGGVASLPEPAPQEGEVSYAAKLTAAELHLDFARPARELHRLVRVGRAWTTFRGGRLLVHRAAVDASPATAPPGEVVEGRVATAAGWLLPLEVQPEGRSRQGFDDFARGARLLSGERLGGAEPTSGTVA